MTSDELQNQLSQTWYREQSADDAHAIIWGSTFDGHTFSLAEKEKLEYENTIKDAAIARLLKAGDMMAAVSTERRAMVWREAVLSLANAGREPARSCDAKQQDGQS